MHLFDRENHFSCSGIVARATRWRLMPVNTAAVLASDAKTGRVLVVDEDYRSFGLTGEIAAVIAEHDPTMLTKPFRRLAVPDVPIPCMHMCRNTGILPTRDKIAASVRDLMS